jgi:hypothetical protein
MRTTLPSDHRTVDPPTTDRGPRAPITPGDEIEIWCRSLGSWSTGFDALDLDAEGWRVRRRSDGSQLPVRFSSREVRPVATS